MTEVFITGTEVEVVAEDDSIDVITAAVGPSGPPGPAGSGGVPPAVVATTADITLSGAQTIDGISITTEAVLVKNQTNTEENGLYVAAAGAWARSTSMDVVAEAVVGTLISVVSGTVNANTIWQVTAAPATLDTDPLIFSAIAGSGTGDALVANPLSQFAATTSLQLAGVISD